VPPARAGVRCARTPRSGRWRRRRCADGAGPAPGPAPGRTAPAGKAPAANTANLTVPSPRRAEDRHMAATDEFVDRSTTAAVEEKAKLQKHFGRFDIFFFLICTLVGLDTLVAVSNDGAQAFTWLVFLAVFFFLPYALLAAELGSTSREKDGAYICVTLAFGRFVAAIDTVLYWLSTPIWLGGSLTILA